MLCRTKSLDCGVTEESHFYSLQGQEVSSSLKRPDRLQSTNSLLWGKLSPGVKRPGCESNHPSPSVAKVKHAWSCILVPPYALMAWCLTENGVVTFYLHLPQGFPMAVPILSDDCAFFISQIRATFPTHLTLLDFSNKKGRAVPLQVWTDPEGSRRLRLPDLKTFGTWSW